MKIVLDGLYWTKEDRSDVKSIDIISEELSDLERQNMYALYKLHTSEFTCSQADELHTSHLDIDKIPNVPKFGTAGIMPALMLYARNEEPCGYIYFNMFSKGVDLRLYGNYHFNDVCCLASNTGIIYEDKKVVLPAGKRFAAIPLVPLKGGYLFGLYLVDLLSNKWYMLVMCGSDYDVIIKSVNILNKYASSIINANLVGDTLHISVGDTLFNVLNFNNFRLTATSFELLDGVRRKSYKDQIQSCPRWSYANASDIAYTVSLNEEIVKLPDFGYSAMLFVDNGTGSHSLTLGTMPQNSCFIAERSITDVDAAFDRVRKISVPKNCALSYFILQQTNSRINLDYKVNDTCSPDIELTGLKLSTVNIEGLSANVILASSEDTHCNIKCIRGDVAFKNIMQLNATIAYQSVKRYMLRGVNSSEVNSQGTIENLVLENLAATQFTHRGDVTKLCIKDMRANNSSNILISGTVAELSVPVLEDIIYTKRLDLHITDSIDTAVVCANNSRLICDGGIADLTVMGSGLLINAQEGIGTLSVITRIRVVKRSVSTLEGLNNENTALTAKTVNLTGYLDYLPVYFRDIYRLSIAPMGIELDGTSIRFHREIKHRDSPPPVTIKYAPIQGSIYAIDIDYAGEVLRRGMLGKYANGDKSKTTQLVNLDFSQDTSGTICLDFNILAISTISSQANWLTAILLFLDFVKITTAPGTQLIVRFRGKDDAPVAVNPLVVSATMVKNYQALIESTFKGSGSRVEPFRIPILFNNLKSALQDSNITALCIPRNRAPKNVFE